MPIEKNIPQLQQAQQNVPLTLALRKEKYEDAGYTYTFSPKEQSYIKYNTLRNKRKDTELVDVVKIYMLKDETEDKIYYVYFQNSKVKDFNNNLTRCPVTEIIGVVDEPQTNQRKDDQDNVVDIELVETHNFYFKEYNKDEIQDLFQKSRNSGNIACYVGFTRNPKTGANDFIDNKKYIRNQKLFMEKEFDELLNLPDGLNRKTQYQDAKKNKKQLKFSTVRKAMVNTDQPENIEERVKDNGQLHNKSTIEITEEENKAAEQLQQEQKQEQGQTQEENKSKAGNTTATNTEEENKNKQTLKVGSGSNTGNTGSKS